MIRKSTLDQAPDLLEAATIYTLIFWLASGLFVSGGFNKSEAAAMWGVLTLGLIVFRYVARRVAAGRAPPSACSCSGPPRRRSDFRTGSRPRTRSTRSWSAASRWTETTAARRGRSARSTTSTTC